MQINEKREREKEKNDDDQSIMVIRINKKIFESVKNNIIGVCMCVYICATLQQFYLTPRFNIFYCLFTNHWFYS